MKNIKADFHISGLISKLLQGTITPDEKALLDNWVNEDAQNYQLYQKLTSEEYLEDELAKYKNIPTNAAWININKKIANSDDKQGAKKYAVLKYAAVLIPFMLTFLVWMYVKNKEKSAIKAHQTRLVKQGPEIHPGSKQAILELSDGSKLTLGKAAGKTIKEENGTEVLNSGNVLTYNNTNQSNNGKPVYNKVIIPRGGEYQLVLEDGTKVWLNSSSSLYYPVQFTGTQREVYLTGEAYFEVAKNKAKPFIVHANETSVQVLGTHFNVSAYNDDAAVTTTLLEGSVKLVNGGQSAMLVPGQQGASINGQSAIAVKNADIEQVMAWKNGYFLFDNMDISSIMKQASRWYDVDVVYRGNLNDKVYSGKISRYSDISTLLKNLELTETIHFTIEGRRVVVMQ